MERTGFVSDFAQCRQPRGHRGGHAPGRERWTGYLDPARCDLLIDVDLGQPKAVYCKCGWSAPGINADDLDEKYAAHASETH